jgi:hypothetical protein
MGWPWRISTALAMTRATTSCVSCSRPVISRPRRAFRYAAPWAELRAVAQGLPRLAVIRRVYRTDQGARHSQPPGPGARGHHPWPRTNRIADAAKVLRPLRAGGRGQGQVLDFRRAREAPDLRGEDVTAHGHDAGLRARSPTLRVCERGPARTWAGVARRAPADGRGATAHWATAR